MLNFNYLKYFILKPFKSWKNKYLKFVVEKDAKNQDLFNLTAKEISEYVHEPIESVKNKHQLGQESDLKFDIFKDQSGLNRAKVEDFYKTCSSYLYSLPLWNSKTNRPKYLSLIFLPYLRRKKYNKLMDFGGGTGDLSIELVKNGFDVSYCDINECLFDFARARFLKRNLKVKMFNGLDNINEKFDCVLSFDAFEHIKDLPQALKNIVSRIEHQGSLIFSGAFSGGTLHLEENEKYNKFKNLDILMQNLGLVFQDKFAQFYFYKKI